MKSVNIIPPKPVVGNTIKKADKPKLRVAAYCRVSTDSDEQATSYEAQIEHYTDYISTNPEWSLAGVYADDGISGTDTKKRDEFNRMIDDCNAGNIDMIITKSISRFARNTLDCLKYIRKLKDINIPVYFEKESINTMDAKGEVLLTIMASLAQQESQSLSQNVKLGLQYRYQQGKVQVNHNRFLGYTKDEDGNLVIDPEQAEVVRRIYREYLSGYSMDGIAKGLESDGILTGAGKKKWYPTTVKKILMNEKYYGDALLQKTYTTDFLSKKRVRNTGIVPQYYVENDHEAIIPKELYLLVQEEMFRRKSVKGADGSKTCYSGKHYFSQIVVCGECGEFYRRVHWSNHGKKVVMWRCKKRMELKEEAKGWKQELPWEKDNGTVQSTIDVEEQYAYATTKGLPVVKRTVNGEKRYMIIVPADSGTRLSSTTAEAHDKRPAIQKRRPKTDFLCQNRSVNEERIKEIVVEAINQLLCEKDDFLKKLEENVREVLMEENKPPVDDHADMTECGHNTLSLPKINARMHTLQENLLKQAYCCANYNATAEELLRLQEMKDQAEKENAAKSSRLCQYEEIKCFIVSQSVRVEEFDEAMVHRLIKRITVYGDRFVVEFKCGVEVTVEG